MQAKKLLRVLLVAAAAVATFAAPANAATDLAMATAAETNTVAALIHPVRALKKKHHAATEAPTEAPVEEEEIPEETEQEEEAEEEADKEAHQEETPAPTKKHKKTHAPATEAPETFEPETEAPAPPPTATEASEPEEETEAPVTSAPKKKKKKHTAAPAPEAPVEEEEEEETSESTKKVNDKKISGNKNEGVIDGSSEGSAEIDKIDLRNNEGWVSVYNDPPLLVIKASLYAFISYNDSKVCDSFNMTLNAVEQKADGNGTYSYHVVTYINCTKDGVDETQGRFILNFIPEGKRLLLTECGHREEGEIVNWLMIKNEVPECMTPGQRKVFLAQPMKHIHASTGSTTGSTSPTQTDFFTRLEDLDGKEVAIVGAGTVALIAIIVMLVVFVLRKRKAQKDLERTIAGAKAEHAVEDEQNVDAEVSGAKERKGLMDSAKAKPDDIEEGSFVNSPAVKV